MHTHTDTQGVIYDAANHRSLISPDAPVRTAKTGGTVWQVAG